MSCISSLRSLTKPGRQIKSSTTFCIESVHQPPSEEGKCARPYQNVTDNQALAEGGAAVQHEA